MTTTLVRLSHMLLVVSVISVYLLAFSPYHLYMGVLQSLLVFKKIFLISLIVIKYVFRSRSSFNQLLNSIQVWERKLRI